MINDNGHPGIQLYLLKTPSIFYAERQSLPSPQRIKAQNYTGKRLTEFTMSRLLLAHALGPSWRIIERDKNSPLAVDRIDNTTRSLSISHSNGWIATAVASLNLDVRFGIDIEKIRTNWSRDKVSFFCTSQQIDQGYELANDKQRDHFFTALWTNKEAYFKATHDQVKEISFESDERLRSIDVTDELILSVFSSEPTTIIVNRMSFDDCSVPTTFVRTEQFYMTP